MSATDPQRTPLYDEHKALGAKIIDFAGWDMPVQYRSIIEEHRAVRSSVGMFDTSHMGQIDVVGQNAAEFLDGLVPNVIGTLAPGFARYTTLCNEQGGIIDDWMIYRRANDHFLVVVNAGGRPGDLAWIRDHVSDGVDIVPHFDDMGMIAVQGPNAVQLVSSLLGFPNDRIARFQIEPVTFEGASCLVARTGYTGEDGFEIFVPVSKTAVLWNRLLEAGAAPCGLGARDTLRLEAALPLYGNDIDLDHNPLEAGLGWTVKLDKPDFIGKAALTTAKSAGINRKLVCFEMADRGIARHGYPVEVDGAATGFVTSGSYAPTVDKAIGMAYVPASHSSPGSEIAIVIRDKPVAATVVPRPFYRRADR